MSKPAFKDIDQLAQKWLKTNPAKVKKFVYFTGQESRDWYPDKASKTFRKLIQVK